jgi:hypothetical protein
MESSGEKDAHVAGLVELVRTAPGRILVVVGHSLLFKQMMATFAAPGVDPAFGAKKLSNCGVMAVDFDFGYFSDAAAANRGRGARGDAGGDARACLWRGNLPVGAGDYAGPSSDGGPEGTPEAEGAEAKAAAAGRAADDGCKPIRAAKLVFGSTFHS